MIIGLLLSIEAGEDDADAPRMTVGMDNVTMDQALDRVKSEERTNVGFDIESCDTDEDRRTFQDLLPRIDAMTWPTEPAANGQFALDAVWCGALSDGGVEWRFVPVIETA